MVNVSNKLSRRAYTKKKSCGMASFTDVFGEEIMDFCEDSNSSFFQDENIDEIFNKAYEAVQFSETLNTTIYFDAGPKFFRVQY